MLLRTFAILLILTPFSCTQSAKEVKSKEPGNKTKEDSFDERKPVSNTDTIDLSGSYIVKTARSYFYNYPDSQSKRNDFLVIENFVTIYETNNGFGFATHPVSSDSSLSGWLLLSTLNRIFFTPPKIVEEDTIK